MKRREKTAEDKMTGALIFIYALAVIAIAAALGFGYVIWIAIQRIFGA